MRSRTCLSGPHKPQTSVVPRRQARPLRPPISILGIPFDNVTVQEALDSIEDMIGSGQPHYVVTANIDFLVQARADVELRRILIDAELVLCDGTPLVWASRWLGNPLPERVAGADLVPLLINLAAEKGYRLFLLGASEESAERAVHRLKNNYPSLNIAGRYSPPFTSLLEMDHEEIKRRIMETKPDVLLVSFGCPKQEKWMWMHYRSLGVPVVVGVGATIDFLAERVRRAPRWMQRSGVEWLFRLAQEPRRLFKRYARDMFVFGRGIIPQLWQLQLRRAGTRWSFLPEAASPTSSGTDDLSENLRRAPEQLTYQIVRPPEWLDSVAVQECWPRCENAINDSQDCVLPMRHVRFVDSTGVGFLIKLQKRLGSIGRMLVLVAPSPAVNRALRLMRLEEIFRIAPDLRSAEMCLRESGASRSSPKCWHNDKGIIQWSGEVTAASVDDVWKKTSSWLASIPENLPCLIDLSEVPFIDSSGLGLMIRAKKQAAHLQRQVSFSGVRPPVRNVVKLANLEQYLLSRR